MITTSTSIEINASAETVFSYVSDFTNNPEWQSGVESTMWTSPPPLRVGSTYDQTLEYKGTVISYTVTAFQEGRSITAESHPEATIPTTLTRTVHALNEDRCRITVELVGRPRGLRRITKPLLRRFMRKSIESDYRRLRELLEAKPEEQ